MNPATLNPVTARRTLPPPQVAVELRRPLLDIVNAMFILDLSRDAVMELIEDGILLWAFDIRTAGAYRGLVRIWNRSVLGFKTGNPPASCEEKTVIDAILPTKNEISAVSLAGILCVNPQHVSKLATDRLIQVKQPGSRGPGNSALICRQSVARFLTSHRTP